MTDLIYIGIIAAFFAIGGLYAHFCGNFNYGKLHCSGISLLLFIYLVVAMLRPEKF